MRILSQCIIITKYTLNTLQFYLLIILNKAEKIKVHLNLKHSYLTSKSCIVLFFFQLYWGTIDKLKIIYM